MTPDLAKPEKRASKPRRRIARTKAPRKRRLSVHAAKVRKANELWRHLIYRQEPSLICPRCHKRPWHDAAHCFIKGRYAHVRFDLDNGAPLCRVCHREIDSDHEAKWAFFTRYLGQERYNALHLRAIGRGKADMDLTLMHLTLVTFSGSITGEQR